MVSKLQSPAVGKVTSGEVQHLLATRFVNPVTAAGHVVAGLRLIWRGNMDVRSATWRKLAQFQQQVDAELKEVEGLAMFVSAISGTVSKHQNLPGKPVDIFPALAYWVVLTHPNHQKLVYALMSQNPLGAAMRTLTTRKCVDGNRGLDLLCTVLKDYNSGFIHEKIGTTAGTTQPLVRVCVRDQTYAGPLLDGLPDLQRVGLFVNIECQTY